MDNSLNGRYAKALFELAEDAGSTDAVAADLDAFIALMDECDDLARLVDSPAFSRAEHLKGILPVLDKAGIKGLSARFIGLLAANGRLRHVRGMVEAFHDLLAQKRGEISVEVATATALSAAQMQQLEKTLKKITGRTTTITPEVDPSLLGGLVVKLGSRMYDNSLRTKLNNLQRAMKEVG